MSELPRILAVDDNKQNLSLLERALTSAQYAVVTAEDGPTALKLIGSAAPDLVLLDVMMPGMMVRVRIDDLKSVPHCFASV